MKFNKGIVVILVSILIQLSIGSIYTWSLFNQPIIDKFGWSKSAVVLTFSISIAFFAFSTIFGGKLQDKFGPRVVASIGGILFGVGVFLSSMAKTPLQLYFTYGLIGGFGVGFVYVCPLATCLKWFPHRKGFVTGIVVGSFGMGSLVFKPVTSFFLNNYGVSETFRYLGIIYLITILFGAQFLSVKNAKDNGTSKYVVDYSLEEMIHTRAFYLLFLAFFFGCISALTVISLAKDIGTDLAKLNPTDASAAVSVIAIFNSAGRVSWGTISDRVGRRRTLSWVFIFTSLSMAALALANLDSFNFKIILAILAFSFGGFLAIYPIIVSEYYGVRHLGVDYGLMYQAYGFAAMVGPILATSFGYQHTFALGSILCICSSIIVHIVHRPKLSKKR